MLFGRHYYYSPASHQHSGLNSNGTHWFNNTVLLVSFDGFKPAYLKRELTPHLVQVSEKGLRAEYMRSIFPTLTFPNHWAIQTGLYAESHGIVGNDFWDPTDNTEFSFMHDDTSTDPKWWFGEPIWETVVKNGLKSASIMWPGPPIMKSGISPTYHRPFHDHVGWAEKKDQIATWLDMPDAQRPQFICAYLPEIDQQGHAYGPDSDEVNRTLREMDKFSEAIHAVLSERNLLDIVNVIYVSDHGMTSTSNERIVYLDEILGEDGFAAIEHKEGWPSAGLRFKPGTNETLMIERIKKGVADSNGGFHFYTHETMPEEFHFSNSPRIAPYWLVPEVGWAITDNTEGWYEAQGRYTPYGNHGYDRNHEDMHAIFVAHGPFAERIKAIQQKKAKRSVAHRLPAESTGSRSNITVIPGFDNLEIYNLITRELLELNNVAPNNGTIGFWKKYLD
ncbi:Phosphodiest-domain-containing protein [Cystobasidium minutum MCA 4210]|uniref:Phosphodiest-domain-containing protein n=1 Tax=Cystobasidium minutum MCA 4210 TaxID=1397322 RepID=UPI0034CFF8B6|eukprot:jgi/Rhomi1/142196/e_gw1.3.291.1